MKDTVEFRSSFNRPNLFYEIWHWKKLKDMDSLGFDIHEFLKANNYIKSSGIIYCLTWEECERLSSILKTWHGLSAGFYHADMDMSFRKAI